MKNPFYFIIILFALLSGCRKSDVAYKDQELYDALNNASKGKGVQYFILPASNDFASSAWENKLTCDLMCVFRFPVYLNYFLQSAYGQKNIIVSQSTIF